MKIKICFLFVCIAIGSIDAVHAQLLNKLKNKANQEVNRLENHATSSAQVPPNKNKLSANVTRTSVVKLNAEESFDYGENCIDLGSSVDQISFILSKQNGSTNECYSYKGGTRTPVACPSGGSNKGCQTSVQCSHSQLREIDMNSDEYKKYVINETESHSIQQPTISDEQMKAMAAYMTPEQLAEVKKQMAEAQKQTAGKSYSTIKSSTVAFNGKKYGPYKLVQKVFLSPDGKNFFAIVMEDKGNSQGQNKMITSASTKTLVLGDMDSPVSCFASADNSDFGYVALGLSAQKYVIVTASGKNYQLEMNSGFNGTWFSATDNHVIYLANDKLYRDGQLIKTFSPGNGDYAYPCDLFVNADGTGVTIVRDNKISFADGDYFEYPLKVSIVYSAGKPYYKWLAFENREVVVYQKPY